MRYRTIFLELNSTCNAGCPLCLRQDQYGKKRTDLPIRNLDFNVIENLYRSRTFQDVDEIILCGNYGDALASPLLESLIDLHFKNYPKMGFIIHTNGSLGSAKIWEKLAGTLNKSNQFVCFAIDGLEDTNHLYRTGVEWQRVMQNLHLFNSQGGHSQWRFILFDHNRHQVDAARSMAAQLGCRDFRVRENYNSQFMSPSDWQNRKLYESSIYPDSFKSIYQKKCRVSCGALTEKSIYIDFSGRVHPCCYISGWDSHSDAGKREFNRRYFGKYAANFNSLESYDLDHILSHSFFTKDLQYSHQNQSEELTHFECLSGCGHEI